MYYPDEVIEEVRSRSDIVTVVGARVKLTKRGGNYFGCCPFHNEKTPSFSVSPGKQMYYCFGCGAGGNVVSFLMAYENYSFPEALEQLAQQAGITLPQREQTAEEKRQEGLRARLLSMNSEAARFYYYQLRQQGGSAGLAYLTGRGLSAETMRRFGLGFAPDSYGALKNYLKSKGFSDEEMMKGGLIKINDRGAYDMFRSRVIYPIMDKNSRVIGFGGRVLGKGEPKYLNSPETPLFDKSRNLYGLHLARSTRRPYFLLCEGYMDVIALHQAGFDCAVASLGTSLTQGHAMLIKRYTDRVIVTYDSDGAGVKAAMRAIPLLRAAGIEVRILNMQPYKDPDEFIVHEGAEAYEERIGQAENYFLYESEIWKRDYDMQDPAGRTAYQHKLAEELSRFGDRLERENYLNSVCAKQLIPAGPLRELCESIGNRRLGQEQRENVPGEDASEEISEEKLLLKTQKRADSGLIAAEQLLLCWAAQGDTPVRRLRTLLEPEDFSEGLYRELLEQILAVREKGDKPVPASLVNAFLEEEEKGREAAAVFTRSLPEDMENEEKCRILTENLRRLRGERINAALKSGEAQQNFAELLRKRRELSALQILPEDL